MDRFVQHSGDVAIPWIGGQINVIGEAPSLNQRSRDDLRALRAKLVNDVVLADCFFGIKDDGQIVIVSAFMPRVGSRSPFDTGVIDALDGLAQRNLWRQNPDR